MRLLQLVNRDAIHPQLLDEHERRSHLIGSIEQRRPRPASRRICPARKASTTSPMASLNRYRAPRQRRPTARAQGVERDELPVAQPNRSRQRSCDRCKSRNEFGKQHRRRAEALENRLGLPDAGIRRQRNAAQRAQHAHAKPASGHIPARIGDQSPCHTDAKQLKRRVPPAAATPRPRSASGRQAQAIPPAREHVQEHKAEAELLDERDQVIHGSTLQQRMPVSGYWGSRPLNQWRSR